jgi:hypothetical protein
MHLPGSRQYVLRHPYGHRCGACFIITIAQKICVRAACAASLLLLLLLWRHHHNTPRQDALVITVRGTIRALFPLVFDHSSRSFDTRRHFVASSKHHSIHKTHALPDHDASQVFCGESQLACCGFERVLSRYCYV